MMLLQKDISDTNYVVLFFLKKGHTFKIFTIRKSGLKAYLVLLRPKLAFATRIFVAQLHNLWDTVEYFEG